jgi:hypothetical protein
MMIAKMICFFLSLLIWNECVLASTLFTKERLSLVSALDYYQSNDLKKYNELKAYIDQSGLTKLDLAGLKIENEKVVFNNGKRSFLYQLDKNGNVTVQEGKKQVSFSYASTLKDIEAKLHETFFSQHHVLLNYFFNEAHAYALEAVIAAVVVFIVLAVYSSFKKDKIQELVLNEDEFCSEVSKMDNDLADVSKMKNSYNKLSDAYMEVCLPKDNGKGYSELVCETKVPKLKKCFKDKIESIQSSRVNNTGRGHVKPMVRYDTVSDKFVSQGLSK